MYSILGGYNIDHAHTDFSEIINNSFGISDFSPRKVY